MFKSITIIIATLMLCACGAKDYTDATESPKLVFPKNSLAVSHRFDIPEIPGNKNKIITDIKPPYY